MARVSIYVPDSMKARMDVFGDTINWSNIAQTVFETELSKRATIGENEMQAVVERIRASKIAYENAEKARGHKDGMEWATKTADYIELRKMAEIDVGLAFDSNAEFVNQSFGIQSKDEDAWFFDEDTRQYESDEYVAAFVDAATKVWEEVRPHL